MVPQVPLVPVVPQEPLVAVVPQVPLVPVLLQLCLSTFLTFYMKRKGKCYLKRMLATPSEYVICSFVCPVSFSVSVQPGFALFNCFLSSCLALSLAPSLEPDFFLFSCFSSSCLSLSLAPSLKPFLLVVYNHWTGLVDWTGGLDWWTGLKIFLCCTLSAK